MDFENYYKKQALQTNPIDYNEYYKNQGVSRFHKIPRYQYGNGNVFKGPMIQKGYGIGDVFKKFFRWIIPIVKTHVIPIVKQGATNAGNELLKTGTDIAKDYIQGKDLKTSAKEHLKQRAISGIDTLSNKTQNYIRGLGIKRKKRKLYSVAKKAKKRKLDIFD